MLSFPYTTSEWMFVVVTHQKKFMQIQKVVLYDRAASAINEMSFSLWKATRGQGIMHPFISLYVCVYIIKPSGFRSLFVVFNIIKPVLFTTSSIDIFFPRMQPSQFYVFSAIKVSQSSLRKGKMTLKKKTALLLIFYIILVSSSSLNTHSHTQFTVAHMRWFYHFSK